MNDYISKLRPIFQGQLYGLFPHNPVTMSLRYYYEAPETCTQ